jgi:hypothetical protein
MTALNTNPLAPQGGETPPDPIEMMHSQHVNMKALFDMTAEKMAHQGAIREALQGLASKGDMVSAEDVIKGAGDMVARGAYSAQEMARVLADMPQSGQALAQWVKARLQQNIVMGQQLAQAHSLARHELGVSGLRYLAHQAASQNRNQIIPGSAGGGV